MVPPPCRPAQPGAGERAGAALSGGAAAPAAPPRVRARRTRPDVPGRLHRRRPGRRRRGHGADVKATDPYGRRWVIYCKHRKAGPAGAPVGTPDLHVLNGTGRPEHRGEVVVLVTDGRFSGPAPEFARSQRLHLVDRATLTAWAGGGRPLRELLRAVPPPRSPGPPS
ncbi:restriction endonuclease [Streptomyces sp. NPDC089173]|uniref:restriction endonuclease n=1 Tax=Streptomyces sp. NPDC089173 TaxID=3154965 RepID=UPI00344C6FAF